MPEISIIVPVYNVEAYLNRCVDSLLGQTYGDFELFLVDDGSTDGSGAICDAYAAKDSRVRVIHQENQGQSAARNHAMEQMRGQWVMFVDSDDWIHTQTLERLRNAALEHKVNISIGGYEDTAGAAPVIQPENLMVELWNPKDFYMQRFINATIPVIKLIRKESLGDLRFPVGKYIDDEYFTYKVLFTQEKLAVIPAPLYAYFINPKSLTKRAWNPRRLDAWEAYEQQIAFFENLGDEDLVRFRYRGYLENAAVNLQAAEEDREKYAAELRFIEKRMRNVIRRAWKRGYMDFWIDYDLLCRFYPTLTRAYRFWIDKIRRG